MGKLFSLVEQSPPGFVYAVPDKRQLLTGHIALYAAGMEDAFALLADFHKRVKGLVISPGDSFSHQEFAPQLWHLKVPRDFLPHLQQLAGCYLDILEKADQTNERQKALVEELTYSNQFYTQTKENYNKAMQRLQVMVQEAHRENEKRREIINQLNHEITKRKQAQEEQHRLETRLHQSQKMEAIGLMAGGVAHDLNNILAGVVGYPDILLSSLPETSEMRRPLENIRESGKRAAEVVSDLLTIARGSAYTFEIANINNTILQYLDSLEFKKLKTDNPNVTFQLQLDKALGNISCSTPHVRKCLMNLVVNGIEAIKDSGTLSIYTRSQNIEKDTMFGTLPVKQGRYVVASVKDTGHGIADEHLAHIFEPFYSRKKMGASGSGLGLTIVWNTVQDHGGAVRVFSQGKQQGTLFELFFPETAKALSRQQDDFPVEQLSGSHETIMVVDDEELLLNIAKDMLQTLGYKVITKNSGEAAIRYLRENSVDLVILDMIMDPGMSGRETYEAILNFHPGQRAVIASGFAENEDVRRALSLGATSFLRKPYTLKSLGKTTKDSLER